jgi:hypothetical protein
MCGEAYGKHESIVSVLHTHLNQELHTPLNLNSIPTYQLFTSPGILITRTPHPPLPAVYRYAANFSAARALQQQAELLQQEEQAGQRHAEALMRKAHDMLHGGT